MTKIITLALIFFSFTLISVASGSEKRTSASWQLGPESSSFNLDFGIARHSTLGLHYQLQFDENRDSKSTYVVRGFSNYGLNYELFLGPDMERFRSGLVVTAGVNYTKLSEGSIHQEITLEQKETFKPGDGKLGGRLAVNYRWYGDSLFAGVGVEGSKVGKAFTFLPVKVQLGLVF